MEAILRTSAPSGFGDSWNLYDENYSWRIDEELKYKVRVVPTKLWWNDSYNDCHFDIMNICESLTALENMTQN